MSRAGAQTWVRSAHLVAALVLGVPTALAGGYVAVIGLAFGFSALADARGSGPGVVLALWGLSGVVGIIAWVRLTLAYAHGDHVGLARCDHLWWTGLTAGIAAASVMLSTLLVNAKGGWVEFPLLFLGPLLIPLALHLTWMRFRSTSDAPLPSD